MWHVYKSCYELALARFRMRFRVVGVRYVARTCCAPCKSHPAVGSCFLFANWVLHETWSPVFDAHNIAGLAATCLLVLS